jgi:hypothetical protein
VKQIDPRLAFVSAYEARPDVRAAFKLVRTNKRVLCGGGFANSRYRLARIGIVDMPMPDRFIYALRVVCSGLRKYERYPVVRTILSRETKS